MFVLVWKAILSTLVIAISVLVKIGDAVLWVFGKVIEALKRVLQIRISLPSLRLPITRTRLKRRGLIYLTPLTLKIKFFFLGIVFSFLVLFLPLLIFIFLQDLPHPKLLASRQIPQTTKIYDRNNTLLYEIYASQNRTLVPLSSVPRHLIDATIAIEDQGFYNHKGIDLIGILRALRETIVHKNLQGGSTITQQLIKSAVLTPEVTIARKIKEIALALWSERIYSKDEILQMYFNQVSYGGTAYGIQAASDVYFGKRLEDLTLAESSFLAGLPAAPSIYSPFSQTPTAWKNRQQEVLRRMMELDFITNQQKEEAEKEQLVLKTPRIPILAPHFVMYVRDSLINRFGAEMVERGGLKVVTSLDLSIQNEVENIVKEEVQAASVLLVSNGAALVVKPDTGEILAMVGSVSFFGERDGNVNATTSLRQPGSSIKVVTYTAALQKGFTAASILDDSPVTYRFDGAQAYSPVNYDGKFRGAIPLRLALGNSLNIPAVKTLNSIGVKDMVDLAKKMGITSWGEASHYGLAVTLGGADVTMYDLTTVYGTLANGGVRKNLNPILKITNYKDDVIENSNTSGEQIIPESIAFIISDILADNNARTLEFGSNSPLRIDGKKVSVKTGTSDNKRDNWTIGYTRDLVAATWVGNFDNSPMHPSLASGITGAAPMWRRIMLYLLNRTDLGDHQPVATPSGVIAMPCQGRMEYFIKGTEKTAPCRWSPSATPSATPTP